MFYIELQELLIALQKGVDSSFTLHQAFSLATFFLPIKVYCLVQDCKFRMQTTTDWLPHVGKPLEFWKNNWLWGQVFQIFFKRVWKLINKIQNNTQKRRKQKFIFNFSNNFKCFRRPFFKQYFICHCQRLQTYKCVVVLWIHLTTTKIFCLKGTCYLVTVFFHHWTQ